MTDHDPTEALRSRAERGQPRGAETVLEGARSAAGQPPLATLGTEPRRHRWVVTAAAVVLVGGVAAGAAVLTRSTGSDPTAPAAVAEEPVCSDLLVYLDPEIPEADRRAIGAEIDAAANVASAVYLDTDVMYQRFRRLFRDEPVMLENVRPTDIPTAYAVRASDPSVAHPLAALETQMGRRAGVMQLRALPAELRCDPAALPNFTDSAGREHGFATATTDPAPAEPTTTSTTAPAASTTTTPAPSTTTNLSTTTSEAVTTTSEAAASFGG